VLLPKFAEPSTTISVTATIPDLIWEVVTAWRFEKTFKKHLKVCGEPPTKNCSVLVV
jgi:hypothetical protein